VTPAFGYLSQALSRDGTGLFHHAVRHDVTNTGQQANAKKISAAVRHGGTDYFGPIWMIESGVLGAVPDVVGQ